MRHFMPCQDLHTHSKWDDGDSSITDMADFAVRAGLTSLGVCVHTPMPFGAQACPQKDLSAFLSEFRAVKRTFAPSIASGEIDARKKENVTRMDEARRAYEKGRIPLSELNREMNRYDMTCMAINAARGLRLYAGAEWDVLSTIPWDEQADGTVSLSSFDYVIGSVHYITVNNPEAEALALAGGLPSESIEPFRYRHFPVDESHQYSKHMVNGYFGGDAGEAIRRYYAQYKAIAENPYVKIVGHFDLPMKFCAMYGFLDREYHVFNENSPAFREATNEAMQLLVDAGKIFELNTRTMLGTTPIASSYRSWEWLSRLCEMGGRVAISSDAHHAADISHDFRAAVQLLSRCGFQEIWVLEETEKDGRTALDFAPRAIEDTIE